MDPMKKVNMPNTNIGNNIILSDSWGYEKVFVMPKWVMVIKGCDIFPILILLIGYTLFPKKEILLLFIVNKENKGFFPPLYPIETLNKTSYLFSHCNFEN